MAGTLVDLVKIVAASSGSGAITLGQPVDGFRGADALVNGRIYSYSIQQGAAWEYGRGTYLLSGRLLTRSPVASSSGGAPINLAPNAQVSFVALAEDLDAVQLAADATTAAAVAEAAALQAATSAGNAQISEDTAAVSQASAILYAAAAQAFADGTLFQSVSDALSSGVLKVNVTANGSGGADGTYTGTFTGGGGSGAQFRFVVASGAVVPGSVVMITKGVNYTSAPTPVFSASTGLTGVTATVTIGPRVGDGDPFLLQGADTVYATLYRRSGSSGVSQNLQINGNALSVILAALLDGYNTAYITGSATTGPGASDGTTLANGVLRQIATPRYDSTYTQLDFWARIIGAAPELVCLRRDENGFWNFYSRSGTLGATVGATGAASRTFSYSVPGGGTRGDTAVFLWTPGCRLAGDATDTPQLVVADPSTVSGASLSVVAQRPLVTLYGTYSQVTDKGAVKAGVDATYGKPAVSLDGLWFGGKTNMQKGQAALRALLAGDADVVWEAYGDSNLAGSHTGDNGTAATPGVVPATGTKGYTNARQYCDLAQFAALARQRRPNGLALPVTYEALMGQNNPQGAYTLYNPRCASTGDFVGTGSAPAYSTLGGGAWLSDGTGDGSAFSYQPLTPVRKFLLGYYTGPGFGSLQYDLDNAGSWTDITCTAGSNGYAELEIDTGSVASHLIRVRRKPGSGPVAFSKIDAWDSTVPSLRLLNAGFPGSTWLSWAQVMVAPWSPYNRMADSAAHFKSIRLGSNDIKNARSLDDILADAQTAIGVCKRNSCVIVEACYPLWDDGAPENALYRQLQLRKRLREVALDNGVMFIDHYAYAGANYVSACVDGLMDDYIHGNRALAALVAAARTKTLAALL